MTNKTKKKPVAKGKKVSPKKPKSLRKFTVVIEDFEDGTRMTSAEGQINNLTTPMSLIQIAYEILAKACNSKIIQKTHK